MHCLEISKELRNDIEVNQLQLQDAIRNHQALIGKAEGFPEDKENILEEVKLVEQKITLIGHRQKDLLEKLREGYTASQQCLKSNVLHDALNERKFNLSTSLNRARKQNFSHHSSRSNSPQDDLECKFLPPQSPPEEFLPTKPHDLVQGAFLANFGLVTYEVYGELINRKRAERKRRSTANPQFLYLRDMGAPVKRKRRHFLARPPSPPNTRGRKRQELAIMSSSKAVNHNGNYGHKAEFKPITRYPNLPSELVIEGVSSGSSSPDSSQCLVCKQPGVLSICSQCSNGFHMSCHNRPFSRIPTECPKCLGKAYTGRNSASSSSNNSSSRMSYVSPTELAEKVNLKQELEEKHKELLAEVTQLQNCHSELTISVKEQAAAGEQLKMSIQETETKIAKLINVIETIKNTPVPETSSS
ncbi:PHD finger protein 21A-like [Euwallacea fornicatus]|uniref:PHD finger protein 21A-like n=1 Tax=Euwallacea fornicatus TaxID=995702 RepID=UPI00338E9911